MARRRAWVSIDSALCDRADALAKEPGVSRSRLHEMALEAFIQKVDEEQLKAQFAKHYANYTPTEEERAFHALGQRAMAELLKDDEW